MTAYLSLGLVRALLTLTLFIAFIGLWVWAWRGERRKDFDAAALLPLQDDQGIVERSDLR
jgi:cytochrome c oxidase cbb3-type subunit 4